METDTNTSTSSGSASDDYKVGYKKPPKNTQFKKGRSGHPEGRPRQKKNSLADDLAETLGEMVIDPDTKRKRIPRFQLVIRKHVTAAGKGNTRALTWLSYIVRSRRQLARRAVACMGQYSVRMSTSEEL